MATFVNFYSSKKGEINKFLSKFYNTNLEIENSLEWKKEYKNPIEIAEIIGTFIDNNEDYDINIWVSLDNGVFINITDTNVDNVIKYLYERFPY